MTDDIMARPDGTGSRASTEPASGLGPSGFDPSRDTTREGGEGHRSFRKLMGTKDQPVDLVQYAAELESVVVSVYHSADQWRWIANEMGYEPDSHRHPPFKPWLAERIAKFRALATTSTPNTPRTSTPAS